MKISRQQFVFIQPFIVDGAKIMLRLFLYVTAVIFVIHAVLSVFFPYPLDYAEAPLVDQARRLASGQNIYQPNLNTPPYMVANYPPLYPLTLAPLISLTGPGFLAGRAISVLSALVAALFLGLIIYSYSKDRLAALATSMMFLIIPYVVHWSGLARVDLLALACSTAALYLLVRRPGARWSIIVAGLLLTAAIYTRQSYALAAPLAAFVWLWTQERRQAIELAVLVAGLSLVLFVLLNIFTGGGFFFNIVTANVNEFNFEQLGRYLANLSLALPLLLSLALVFVVIGRNRVGLWPLLASYLIGAMLSALTIVKVGSNVNYLLELAAALSLMAGVFIFWSRTYPWRHAALLILLALQTGLLIRATLEQAFDERLTWRRSEAVAIANLASIVAETDGPILADEFMGLITLQKQPLYIQPFEVTQLAQAGLWDQTPLLEAIQQQKFPLILIYQIPFSSLHKERWTPEMLSAIQQNYRPVRMEALTIIYRPQEGQAGLAVPEPTRSNSFSPEQVQLGPLRRISQVPYIFQPDISVNPMNPDHLAAIVTTTSFANCDDFVKCQTDLMFYISTDGGETWIDQRPFTKPRQFSFSGSGNFGPDGTLYIVGNRDEAVTLNQTHSDTNYEINYSNQMEVTKAQVSPKPWLRIDPKTGVLFLSYAAQYRSELVNPSLNRSTDAGVTWSFTARADQSVGIDDVRSGRVLPPSDVQVIVGEDKRVALVWTWDEDTWNWPRDVWIATSTDGGENFSAPKRIAETWGPIHATSQADNYYIVYRPGTEQAQELALAVSNNSGRTWTSNLISGNIPLTFDIDKAPGLDVAPNGTIDVLFYAHAEGPAGCALDLQRWQEALETGWTDTCTYNVYFTYSQDGGRTFSEPLQLNKAPIQGNRFIQINEYSLAGSHMGMASTDVYAYPIWIETQDAEGTQAYTVRIER